MALQSESLLKYFNDLFYLCKFTGLYPHDLQKFQKQQILVKSKFGSWFVIAVMLLVIVFYNLLIMSFAEDSNLRKSQSTLNFVIGLFLTYIGLMMMMTDQLTAVRNQKSINELYERIQMVDEKLRKDQIVVNNLCIRKKIRILIALTVLFELTIIISTYAILIDFDNWTSLLWIFSCVPTFFNSLDKIWVVVTLSAVSQRFYAINSSLEQIVAAYEQVNGRIPYKLSGEQNARTFKQNLRYFHKEMNELKSSANSRIVPISQTISHAFDAHPASPQKKKFAESNTDIAALPENDLKNVYLIEEKLTVLCQVHDELCVIGKMLNELWNYPLLVLMGYGFLIFTAQLYFLYCATQGQPIPTLFRSARNVFITTIYLTYTAGKCIYLMYTSWKASMEAKRSGICMHKCSIVADNDYLYEIINHLSLKLLNHTIDFSACGFFTLDMESLYAASGGITSYLIILIQFNLAAQQAKDAITSPVSFKETAELIAAAEGGAGTSENYTL